MRDEFLMSFMYNRKRIGPKIVPCGTLHEIEDIVNFDHLFS